MFSVFYNSESSSEETSDSEFESEDSSSDSEEDTGTEEEKSSSGTEIEEPPVDTKPEKIDTKKETPLKVSGQAGVVFLQMFLAGSCDYFLVHWFECVLGAQMKQLIVTVSSFEYPQHLFWLRYKDMNSYFCTLILGA